jgi:hypothetical protein
MLTDLSPVLISAAIALLETPATTVGLSSRSPTSLPRKKRKLSPGWTSTMESLALGNEFCTNEGSYRKTTKFWTGCMKTGWQGTMMEFKIMTVHLQK